MRKVLIISHDADLAGVNYGIKQAFDRYSSRYRVRQVVGALNYIRYPYDIMWMGNNTLVNELYDKADIVHMTEHHQTLTAFVPKIWNPVKKPTVLHQHGTTFRVGSAFYLDLCKKLGWTQVVSTLDLKTMSNEVIWVPNPADVDKMSKMRVLGRMNVHLMHAPTNRAEKDTNLFEANAIRLAATHENVTYEIVERQTWETSLARKAHADVFYDQLTYGYGNNGIEAMSMGIPVISGFANSALYQDLPMQGFFPATKESLGDIMRMFVEDKDLREKWGQRGQEYARLVHDEPVVVKKWEEVYDKVLDEA